MKRTTIIASLLVLFLLGLVPAFAIAKAKPPASQAAASPANGALGSCKQRGKRRFRSALQSPAKCGKKGRRNGTPTSSTTTQTSTTSSTSTTQATTSTTTRTTPPTTAPQTTCANGGNRDDAPVGEGH